MEILILAPPGTKVRDLLALLEWLREQETSDEESCEVRIKARRSRRGAQPKETIEDAARRLEAGDFTPEDLQRWAKMFGLRFGKDKG